MSLEPYNDQHMNYELSIPADVLCGSVCLGSEPSLDLSHENFEERSKVNQDDGGHPSKSEALTRRPDTEPGWPSPDTEAGSDSKAGCNLEAGPAGPHAMDAGLASEEQMDQAVGAVHIDEVGEPMEEEEEEDNDDEEDAGVYEDESELYSSDNESYCSEEPSDDGSEVNSEAENRGLEEEEDNNGEDQEDSEGSARAEADVWSEDDDIEANGPDGMELLKPRLEICAGDAGSMAEEDADVEKHLPQLEGRCPEAGAGGLSLTGGAHPQLRGSFLFEPRADLEQQLAAAWDGAGEERRGQSRFQSMRKHQLMACRSIQLRCRRGNEA